MATYSYSRQSGQETRSILKKILPILAIVAIGPLAIFYATLPDMVLPFLVFYLVIVAFAFVLAIYRQSHSLLNLDNNQITLRRSGMPDISILRTEVKKIERRGEHGIAVISQSSNDSIFIPDNIEGFANVRNELNSWYPIEPELPGDNRLLIATVSVIVVSSISAVGAFVFKLEIFLYLFVLSFSIIAIGSLVGSFKKLFAKRSEGGRSRNLFERIIFVLVVSYLIYKIISSSI